MPKSRASKERRDARRQSDRDWIIIKCAQLRILGMPGDQLERARETFPTRGAFQRWMNNLAAFSGGKYAAVCLTKKEYDKYRDRVGRWAFTGLRPAPAPVVRIPPGSP